MAPNKSQIVKELPIIVLIGAAEKQMMLGEFNAENKKQKEENKKPKDMQKKRNIE